MNAALRRYFHYSASHFGNTEAVGSLRPIVAGLALVTSLLLLGPCAFGENLSSGTIRGSVLDPSGAAVKGAAVEIQNPVTGYSRAGEGGGQGNFEFPHAAFSSYPPS